MCQGLLTPIIRFWEMTKEDNPVTEGQINMCQGGIKKVFLKGSYKYRWVLGNEIRAPATDERTYINIEN